jgi:uncharacterized membrane-anchored protein YhcB (DUF1043 family)
MAAGSIYALTNFASLSAPLAGSFVSAGQVIASLVNDLNLGIISFDKFTDLSQLACMESAAAGLASAVGQTMIPVPIIGAILGIISGRIVIELSRKYLDQGTERLKHQLDEYYCQCMAKIDRSYRVLLSRIITEYDELVSLSQLAFDQTKNVEMRLKASLHLAQAYEVPEKNIIRNINELDDFMVS